MHVDLNADVGESFGSWVLGPRCSTHPAHYVSECRLRISRRRPRCHARNGRARASPRRCGRRPSRLSGPRRFRPARDANVAARGRRPRRVPNRCARRRGRGEGVRLQHVKPHGALYNMAVTECRTCRRHRSRNGAPSIGHSYCWACPGRSSSHAGERAGLRTASEVFADRAYRADGTLVPRTQPGAVIHDEEVVVQRVVAMVREGAVVADGRQSRDASRRYHLCSWRHARRRAARRARAGRARGCRHGRRAALEIGRQRGAVNARAARMLARQRTTLPGD